MANATAGRTIRAEEAAHFGKLAGEWWDPHGSSAMLHRMNPVRLGYVREAIDRHWPDQALCRHPLAGKRVRFEVEVLSILGGADATARPGA